MGVDSFDWDAFNSRIFQRSSCQLEGRADVVRGYIELLAVVEICRDDCFLTGPVLAEVEVMLAQCPYWAMGWVTIRLLVDAYSFPPILLVVQFHGGVVCRFYFLRRGIPRQTTKITLFVLGKESDVPKFEFLSLFCVIPRPFCSVFAYA